MSTWSQPECPQVEQARRMYQVYLRNWASSILELRRLGLDRPTWRPSSHHAPIPFPTATSDAPVSRAA